MSTQRVSLVQIEFDELKEAIREVLKEELRSQFTVSQQHEEKVLTRKEVAAKLGISLPTLADRMKTGAIPFRRLGSKYLFLYSEVLSCMKPVQTMKYKR